MTGEPLTDRLSLWRVFRNTPTSDVWAEESTSVGGILAESGEQAIALIAGHKNMPSHLRHGRWFAVPADQTVFVVVKEHVHTERTVEVERVYENPADPSKPFASRWFSRKKHEASL